jgi:O-antigen/teichoic acid export membrane protein
MAKIKKLRLSVIQANIALKLFTNSIVFLITVALSYLVPRTLGPATYGNFNYIHTLLTKVVNFFSLGTIQGFYTRISGDNREKWLVSLYLKFVFIQVILTGILLIFSLYFFPELLGFDGWNVVLYVLAFFYSLLMYVLNIFRQIFDAIGKTNISEYILLTQRILIAILVLAASTSGFLDLKVYYVILASVLGITLMILLRILYKGGFFIKSYCSLRKLWFYVRYFKNYSSPIFLLSIVVLIVGVTERVLVQRYGGSTEQGYFGLGLAVSTVFGLLVASVVPIFTREASRFVKVNDTKSLQKAFVLHTNYMYHILSCVSVFLVFKIEILVPLIWGENFSDGSLAIGIMLLLPLHQLITQMSTAVLYSTSNTREIRKIGIPINILGILGFYIFLSVGSVHISSSVGLACKMLMLQFVSSNFYLLKVAKLLELEFALLFLGQLLVPLIFIVIIWSIKSSFNCLGIDGSLLQELLVYTVSSAIYGFVFFKLKYNYSFNMKK